MNQLFVSLVIYTLPMSKKDLRWLVIRCCENRHRKSKTRKEEEEASRPATWTNIASVGNVTFSVLGPRKLRAKFIIPELHHTDNYLFKENPCLF